jgi:hypothetical protein
LTASAVAFTIFGSCIPGRPPALSGGSQSVFMNVTCPACGQRHRMPESAFGQQVTCPSCSAQFRCEPGSTRPAEPRPAEQPVPVQAAAQVRAAGAGPSPGIRFSCPGCRKPLEAPAQSAGQKVNCPDCGQRLQIPQPSGAPASVPVRVVAAPPPAAPPPPVKAELIPTAVDEPAPPVRREHCLECGTDITDRPRIQTCPDCGSIFCSAMCYREHRYHAH